MRILHIVAGLPPGGGISESVPALCRHLRRAGHEVTLVTLNGPMSEAALLAGQEGVRLVCFTPSWPKALFYSAGMLRGLLPLAVESDVVHVHSNWTFPVWWACRCTRKAGKPLVMSPRGCLDPVRLRHSTWKKRLVGWLDRYFLRHADVIHATCDAEAQAVTAYVGSSIKARIVVIPNGVDAETIRRGENSMDMDQVRRKMVLYLGRLHPLKGLDLLIDAWARRKSLAPKGGCSGGDGIVLDEEGWRLVIAGPDEKGVLRALQRQVVQLGIETSVVFSDPVYGEKKDRLFALAGLFVLPTRHENFGIVVAEALAHGLPVITTKGAPWSELLGRSESPEVPERDSVQVDNLKSEYPQLSNANVPVASRTDEVAGNGRCGWWVDVGVEPLAEALGEAMSLTDEQRRTMGENGRRLVACKYRWDTVAQEMAKVYEGLVKNRV